MTGVLRTTQSSLNKLSRPIAHKRIRTHTCINTSYDIINCHTMKWRPVPHRTPKQLCSFSFHCGKLQGRGVVHRHPDAISAFLRMRFVPLILQHSSAGCYTRSPATSRRKGDKKSKENSETLFSDTRVYTAMRVPLCDRLVTWLVTRVLFKA